VRDDDQELWQEAERLSGGNLSALLTSALRSYVASRKALEGTMERIVIEIPKPDGGVRDVAFTGRWLVSPGDDIRSGEPFADAGVHWGVALTKRGQIAVHAEHVNSGPLAFDTYADIDAAMDGGLPQDIATLARAELDPDFVEELDI
jgi:hypothetical protein